MKFRCLSVFLLLTVIAFSVPILELSAATGSNKIRYTKAFNKRYVYLRDIADYYDMSCYVWKEKTVIKNRWHNLTFYHDKQYAYIDSIKVDLMHSPFRRDIQSFVSENDFMLFLDPILRHYALNKSPLKVIMLDPGHGGKDVGGTGKRKTREKDLVMEIALKLRQRLRDKGYVVLLTRSYDKTVSLAQRTILAGKMSPDIFVSIHANIAAPSVSGIETFFLAPVGTASSHSSKPSYDKEKGNKFDKNSAALAYQVQRNLIRYTKAADRGVKRSRFYVLKNASCPAVLVELGFLSNTSEESKMRTDSYQDLLVRGIEMGILSYHSELRKK